MLSQYEENFHSFLYRRNNMRRRLNKHICWLTHSKNNFKSQKDKLLALIICKCNIFSKNGQINKTTKIVFQIFSIDCDML